MKHHMQFSTLHFYPHIPSSVFSGVCVCVPAERPAETHTAVDAGAAGPCGVARCSPAVSGGAGPHG